MDETRLPTYTNQHVIDAFYNVAKSVGRDDPWSLLIEAGLDLEVLAADRQAPYTGSPLDELPALTDAQRTQVIREVTRLSAKPPLWRGIVEAPAGLSLRAEPDADAQRLTVLLNGAPVDVLEELEDWLRVRADDYTGYAYRPYVIKENVESDDGGGNEKPNPVNPAPRFLWQSPRLGATPLAPDAAATIAIDPARMNRKQLFLARVWNRYGGLLQALADELGFDPKVAVAVFATEAGRFVLADDERMVIRFENHIFFHEWGRNHPEEFDRHFCYTREPPGNSWRGHEWRRDANGPWQPCHNDQDGEWAVLDYACTLNENAAKRAISMGVAQIMGFNCRLLGYGNAQGMFDALSGNVRRQIFGFFDFVAQHPGTVEALRDEDFLTFARIYNGPGQMETYETLISDNHQALQDAAAPQAMPAPPAPVALPRPADPDPALQEAWREHIKHGFTNNQKMFSDILDAFMKPYYTTVWMYRILFAVGIVSVVAALWFAFTKESVNFSALFLGMGAVSFITYFLSRPLRSLEENLQFITWLGIIYNTYWTRQAFMLNEQTVQADLEMATQEAIIQLERMIDKNATLESKRPDLNGNG